MTDKQPEALRLADALDSDLSAEWMNGITLKHISNELRRLHEENEALRAKLAQPEQESAYGYASRLATAIWEKHYKDESPHWKVNDSLLGVLTQIDNMTTGLVRAQPEQEIEPDRDHVEDDGCPTEKAVLQRFWRKHQKQEPVACPYCHYSHTLGAVFFDQNCAGCVNRMTAPPQREWQGLTEAERIDIIDEEITAQSTEHFALAQAIEAKLKEKNT